MHTRVSPPVQIITGVSMAEVDPERVYLLHITANEYQEDASEIHFIH